MYIAYPKVIYVYNLTIFEIKNTYRYNHSLFPLRFSLRCKKNKVFWKLLCLMFQGLVHKMNYKVILTHWFHNLNVPIVR